MMSYQKFVYTLVCLLAISQVISADGGCDKSKCKGAITYYEDLKCTPIYGEDKCCPVKYNCDHLNGRSADKCYYNGREYAINEKLREEDARPCDKECFCRAGSDGIAQFSCAVVDCFGRTTSPTCFLKASHDNCCDGPEICPVTGHDYARCEVDGKTYLAGQRFYPESDPTKTCICAEGYSGENVEPFCKTIVRNCGVELRQAHEVRENCPPVFYSNQNPATDCNIASRCQNRDDVVLPAKYPPSSNSAESCNFGNLTMKLGDELNQGTNYDSVCVRCVCDVPPIPTCKRLPDDVCDVTVHKKFDDF